MKGRSIMSASTSEKAAPSGATSKTSATDKAAKHSRNKSYCATPASSLESRAWFVVDATDKPLGRLASEVASVLRGKHKPTYTPHVDTGDFVVVVNADKVKLTGTKLDNKFWNRHSGIPGGFKANSYRDLLKTKPTFPIEKAVKGMLPKCVLGREMITKLKVYATPDHPHAAQKPTPLTLHI
jgi:large subunit ribosomal protein L13